MGRKKEKKQAEDEAEDWCFVCKDGGKLLICDHKGCGKAYHPGCVGRKNSVLKSEGRWTCSRHNCSKCGATPQVYCLCCPKAVCDLCVKIAKFVSVKLEKGLCKDCLNMALDVGQDAKFDSKEVKIDSEDPERDKTMFKEYLEIIVKQEGLTFDDLNYAELKRENHGSRSDADKSEGKDSGAIISISDDGSNKDSVAIDNSSSKRKKSEVYNTEFAAMDNSYGETSKSEVRDYVGWGSKPLINFLKSVGRDVTKKLPQLDVDRTISSYVLEKNLFCEEKNVVFCDEMLYSLFQKKVVHRDEMINLLAEHFIDTLGQANSVECVAWGSKPLINFLESFGKDVTKKLSKLDVDITIVNYILEKNLFREEKKRIMVFCDDKLYSLFRKKVVHRDEMINILDQHFTDTPGQANSAENEYDRGSWSGNEAKQIVGEQKRRRTLSPDNVPLEEKVDYEVQKSSYASIVAENMKLVYLRRSLVEELLMDPDNFENKVVGSFVRVKTKIGNVSEKTPFRLQQVTGIKKTLDAGGVLLEFSCMSIATPICMLDDDDISEEECLDLRDRMKDGLLRKPTVAELEQKAKSLHEDITKNWIQRELVRLQKKIDFLHEKGRRYMLDKTLYHREKLKNSSEQQRLLQRLPRVIVEEIELDPSAADSSESKGNWIGQLQSSAGKLTNTGA